MAEQGTIRMLASAAYDRKTGKLIRKEYCEVSVDAYAKMLIRIFETHARMLGAEPFADLIGLKGAVCPYPMNTYHERLQARREEMEREAITEGERSSLPGPTCRIRRPSGTKCKRA